MPRKNNEANPLKAEKPAERVNPEPNGSVAPDKRSAAADGAGDSQIIKSIAQLIELSEQLASWKPDGTKVQWAFRGQSQDFGTLVPSFQRQFTHQYLGAAEQIEQRLIKAFREHYANVAKSGGSDMPAARRIGVGYDLRCLSVMQHYEIPTRLLDWTGDFWTAVYFACASDPTRTAELWYYDRNLFVRQRTQNSQYQNLVDRSEQVPQEPYFLNMRNSNLIIELDFQITPRMDQQKAHHTVCTEVFSDHVQLIEGLAKQVGLGDPEQPVLHRDLIDASAKGKVLQYLAEQGITAGTIFPDVVGLGRFLRWQFESLRTMLM